MGRTEPLPKNASLEDYLASLKDRDDWTQAERACHTSRRECAAGKRIVQLYES